MTENFNFGRTQRRPSDPSCHCHCVHACKKPPSHHLLPIKASTHRLMLPKFRFLFKIKSRTPMSKHTPVILAAMAVHSVRGTAILLIWTLFSLSTPLTTTPHQLLPSSLQLPSQKPFNSFPLFFMASFIHHNFLLSTSPNIGLVVRFFIVFSEDVAHIGLDQIFGSRMQEPLTCTDFLLVFASHCEITIYPFADHLTVSTQL